MLAKLRADHQRACVQSLSMLAVPIILENTSHLVGKRSLQRLTWHLAIAVPFTNSKSDDQKPVGTDDHRLCIHAHIHEGQCAAAY